MKIFIQLLSALLLLLAGACVLAITYFFTYAVIWFGFNFGISSLCVLIFNKRYLLHPEWIRWICFAFLILLFIENIRVHPEYWQSYSIKYKVPGFISLAVGPLGALAALLANMGASSKVISELLLTGPKLVTRGALSLVNAVKILLVN